jgi:hypothetical protein
VPSAQGAAACYEAQEIYHGDRLETASRSQKRHGFRRIAGGYCSRARRFCGVKLGAV